ncbi:hypothetical protein GCM10027073_51610 [Streptomyces chlorus]
MHAAHTGGTGGGDHLIVVGRVHALGTGDETGAPLPVHRGRFTEGPSSSPPNTRQPTASPGVRGRLRITSAISAAAAHRAPEAYQTTS